MDEGTALGSHCCTAHIASTPSPVVWFVVVRGAGTGCNVDMRSFVRVVTTTNRRNNPFDCFCGFCG